MAGDDTRVATFDCYGTLIDWEGGAASFLRPERKHPNLLLLCNTQVGRYFWAGSPAIAFPYPAPARPEPVGGSSARFAAARSGRREGRTDAPPARVRAPVAQRLGPGGEAAVPAPGVDSHDLHAALVEPARGIGGHRRAVAQQARRHAEERLDLARALGVVRELDVRPQRLGRLREALRDRDREVDEPHRN